MDETTMKERMQFVDKIRADIDRIGWSAVHVFPTEPGEGYPFTYTIGLTETFGHPELVVYGPPQLQGHGMVASAVDELRSRRADDPGYAFEVGGRYPRVVRGFVVGVRQVSSKDLSAARRFYGPAVRALQLVWPDESGLFPWEDGCEESCVASQTQADWSVEAVRVYVPVGDGPRVQVADGSGIVGSPVDDEWVKVDFEGAVYGQANLRRYVDRVACAYGRQSTGYPTVARAVVRADTLAEVGVYDPLDRRIRVDDDCRELLAGWLGVSVEGLDSELEPH